jgi:hypothetical protein
MSGQASELGVERAFLSTSAQCPLCTQRTKFNSAVYGKKPRRADALVSGSTVTVFTGRSALMADGLSARFNALEGGRGPLRPLT